MIQMILYAIYRNNVPVKDEKLPEHKGEINNDKNVAPTVSDEKQEQSIEIVEKEEEKEDEHPDEKKQDQVANDKTELKKTGDDSENCQV